MNKRVRAYRSKIAIFWYKYARLNFLGLLLGTIAFCLSLLPSLLPRPWLYQGIISGLSFSLAYAIGVLFSAVIRWMFQAEVPIKLKRVAWRLAAVVLPMFALIYVYLGGVWQEQVRELVGEAATDSRASFRMLLVALVVFVLAIALGRGVRRLTLFLINQLDRLLPRRVSIALGLFMVVALFFWVLSGVFYNFFVTQANRIYASKNNTTPAGIVQPSSVFRSGSPASLVPWNTLGYQGQSFVGTGPTNSQLKQFNNAPVDPVRVYVGLKSADSPEARAKLAVDELRRTNAFSRRILILATPTGTGWLEPQSVDSLEYMYGGDSAIVAQQYSYLPSWISFLVDQDNATDAGQALFNAVHAAWAELPANQRPKLIAYGLSLGSFGGQAAYSGVNDLRYSTDGALFVGTPNDTRLWQTITANRDPGTPEWQPVYQNGQAVRFAATNETIAQNQAPWQPPRMLYLQHASDPVVWFSFDLALSKPDWLNEKRGPDVSPTMRWYPFITFLQVGIDQFFGTLVPNGHGHNYANTMVAAWMAVAQPDNWSLDQANRLQTVINAYPND